jgi:hypothetical protein
MFSIHLQCWVVFYMWDIAKSEISHGPLLVMLLLANARLKY